MLAPILEDVSETRDDAKFLKVDVDENYDLAKSFGILEHRCSFYKNQLGTGMPYRSLSPDWKHNPIRQRIVCENILNMQGFSRLASAVKNRQELVCVCSLYKLKEIYTS